MTSMTPRAKNLALMLLAMTQFVVVIDASIVNIALPSIGVALHFSQADLSWVVNAYTLTFGGFLLLGGRLADLVGRRRMFMIGLIVFSVASLLGGLLTSGLNWRWVLFVNVPIGLVCAALAPRILLESRAETETREFDIPGAVTVTAGLALLVYALVDAVNVGWGSTATILRLAGAFALLAIFLAIESRARSPLMPFSIFRLRTLRGADAVALLIGMSLFSMFFFVSLYMQQVLHYSALRAGVSYLPLAVGIILSAGAASFLVTRFGFKPVLLSGLLFVAAGLFWFSKVPASGGSFSADVLGPSLLAAVGLGLSFVPVTIAAVSGTRPHEAGLASGLVNTAQQVGGALGLAILATVANSATKSALHAGGHNLPYALTKGFERAFLVGSGFALIGALLTVVMISSRDSRAHSNEARSSEASTEAATASA